MSTKMATVETYRVVRTEQGVEAFVLGLLRAGEPNTFGSRELPLVAMHTGQFEYGYLGGGPSDLALAILVHHLGASTDPQDYHGADGGGWVAGNREREAWRLHRLLMEVLISRWPRGVSEHEVPAEQIATFVTRYTQ